MPVGKHTLNRRGFLRTTLAGFAAFRGFRPTAAAQGPRGASAEGDRNTFRVWATSDAHVGTDLRHGRESLAEAIRQSERGGKQGGPPLDWDIALHLGDVSGNQGSPADEEGREVLRQLAAAQEHRREQFYFLAGNHDASLPGEPTMAWYRKWIDPVGENTADSGVDPSRRPFAVQGTWERYWFRAGNVLFLMMSDRNCDGPPVGRGQRGGYPAGAVTEATFQWWKRMVENNRGAVIVCAHHHMLKETTVASGPWEGFVKSADGKWQSKYHGYFPEGAPQGASYLYFVGNRPDAGDFERYLAARPGAVDLWLGGHTHTHPDDRTGGRSHVERKWGTTFINVAALTRYHGRQNSRPMSRLLTFTEGSTELRIQCYLHTSEFAPQGFYGKAEQVVKLAKPFRFE